MFIYRVIQKGGHKLETYTLQDHQKKGFETLCIVDDTMDFATTASPQKNPENLGSGSNDSLKFITLENTFIFNLDQNPKTVPSICLFSGLFCIYSCGQPMPVLSL